MHDQWYCRVLGGIERREQIELLENEAYGLAAKAAERPAAQSLKVRAKNGNISFVGPKHRRQYGDQRSLPTTRRPDEEGHLTGAGIEVRTIQHDFARFSCAEALVKSPGNYSAPDVNPGR